MFELEGMGYIPGGSEWCLRYKAFYEVVGGSCPKGLGRGAGGVIKFVLSYSNLFFSP